MFTRHHATGEHNLSLGIVLVLLVFAVALVAMVGS